MKMWPGADGHEVGLDLLQHLMVVREGVAESISISERLRVFRTDVCRSDHLHIVRESEVAVGVAVSHGITHGTGLLGYSSSADKSDAQFWHSRSPDLVRIHKHIHRA
jgi:hypothetical protein